MIGLPGSGKTTASQKITEKYNTIRVHLSVGEILRTEAKKDTDRGKLINNLITQGKLVPFVITLAIMADFFISNNKQIILINGYQGTKDYIEPFHNLIDRHNIKFSKAISFNIPIKTALERCKARTRTDDSAEALYTRIENRLKNITDIQQCYKSQGLLTNINGDKTQEEVVTQLEQIIFDKD